jgi:hypothetical protein
MYRDTVGWTIHRKRAWTAALSGCHYDYIDFSITVGSEAGTAASRAQIRSWFEHLSDFMASFDFEHSRLDDSWIGGYPDHLVASALAANGRDFIAYLGDARELDDPGAGQPIAGSVSLALPPGSYNVSLYSPVTGQASPAIRIEGGKKAVLALPAFTQDIVLRAVKQNN